MSPQDPNTPSRLAPAADFPPLGRVCRLGLATRGNTHLPREGVEEAVRRGVNYFNGPGAGHRDGLTEAVRAMSPEQRSRIRLAAQFQARSASEAREELAEILADFNTSYIDVLTYYYVEEEDEWETILAEDGAATELSEAKKAGKVRAIGVTTHQRPLAAKIAQNGRVDLLMIRYNAAHRGAESEVFPVTGKQNLPVVAYTALRWGAMMGPTPDDPEDFTPPSAPDCYRYVLENPHVTVALAAPNCLAELEEDLAILDDWRGLTKEQREALNTHGQRVRRWGGAFP